MKPVILKIFISALFCSASLSAVYGQLYEWRGPDRTGIYNETGLMKKWPDSGPKLLWETGNMGAFKLKLSPDGNSVDIDWENRNFDPQHGNALLAYNIK